jgi:hypothetical protein
MPRDSQRICPRCYGPVEEVRQSPTSPLNRDQFDASKAGDFFCRSCPDNGRGISGLCYWWESELPPVHDYSI